MRPQALWLQFVLLYRAGEDELYAFFEGREDCCFYLPELRRRTDGRFAVVPIRCGGKQPLLDLIPRVRGTIDQQSRALFFVDKDFDDVLGVALPTDRYVFATQHYSFENYLVSEAVLDVILDEIFQLPRGDQRRTTVLAEFRRGHASFLRKVLPIMAWLVVMRRRGLRPNVQNINLATIFALDGGEVSRSKGVLGVLDLATGVTTDRGLLPDLRRTLRELRRLPAKSVVRGKFELWWLVQFLLPIEQALGERVEGVPRNRVVVQVRHGNAAEVLSGRVMPPVDLRAFLDAAIPNEGTSGHGDGGRG